MKKMLMKLFLFLFLVGSLNFSISGGEYIEDPATVEKRFKRVEHNRLVMSIVERDLETEIADLAYADVDSIPLKSPIDIYQLDRISSDYGWRKHPMLKKWMFHKGLDIVAPRGTDIKATAHGVVEKIEKSNHGYGNQILIRHGYGYETRYAHLSNIKVDIGQKVKAGDVIGTLGSSGMSTGPHIHYEIINNDKQIDPMFFSYADKSERSRDIYISTLKELERT